MALKADINRRAVAVSAFTLMALVLVLITMSDVAAAERPLMGKEPELTMDQKKMDGQGLPGRVISLFWQSGKSSYKPVWPVSVQISSLSYIQSSCFK